MSRTLQNNSENSQRKDRQLSTKGYRTEFICWGCGEHGQNAKSDYGDSQCDSGILDLFEGTTRENSIKYVSCGSSHTVAVTCKYVGPTYIYRSSNRLSVTSTINNVNMGVKQASPEIDLIFFLLDVDLI